MKRQQESGSKDQDSKAANFSSLRSYAKHRILNDMIEKTARRHAHSKDYMIMVLDGAALRVFSSCCKFFDVYKANLYHIERLEVRRKRFPQTDAVYFISPTKESIDHLLNDFSEQSIDVEKKPVQYSGVHLCFTSRVSDELLKQIAQRKHLAPRVLSFNEINLDFYLFNDNVFHLSRKNVLPAFKLADEGAGVDHPAIQRLLNEMCHRVFTVCSVLLEWPFVVYQGNSTLSKALAQKINEVLKTFYTQAQANNTKALTSQGAVKIREPRGTILIVDRSFDLISPVIHDYYYQSLVYEFKEVGEEGEVSIGENGKKLAFLNDQDDLWVRFRGKHIAEVHATLNQEVSAVAAESKRKVGGGKSTDDMSLQDMAEVIRSMPKYEEMMKKYQVHMELINKGITEFTSYNLRKLISLEQDIITGVDSRGQKINNTSLVKEISQISKMVRQEDYVRLLMIYFSCYDLAKKDRDTLLKSVENESFRTVLQNMEYLDTEISDHSKKLRRRKEEMNSDQFNEFSRRLANSEYEILRSEPAIITLIKSIYDNTLDTKHYPFMGEKPEPKQAKKPKAEPVKRKGAAIADDDEESKIDDSVNEAPRILAFVIGGGLCHHEIASMANLQQSINAQIIPGSNEIMLTAKDYMTQLERLHKKESDLAFIKGTQAGGKGASRKRNDEEQELLENTGEVDDEEAGYAINQ